MKQHSGHCDAEWINGHPYWRVDVVATASATICEECRTRMIALELYLRQSHGTCDCGGEASSGTQFLVVQHAARLNFRFRSGFGMLA